MATPGDGVKKFTADAKIAVQMVFEDLGGVEGLKQWAMSNPQNLNQFYTQIWPKIIPKDIKSEVGGKNGGPVRMSISWDVDPEDANLLPEPKEPTGQE